MWDNILPDLCAAHRSWKRTGWFLRRRAVLPFYWSRVNERELLQECLSSGKRWRKRISAAKPLRSRRRKRKLKRKRKQRQRAKRRKSSRRKRSLWRRKSLQCILPWISLMPRCGPWKTLPSALRARIFGQEPLRRGLRRG